MDKKRPKIVMRLEEKAVAKRQKGRIEKQSKRRKKGEKEVKRGEYDKVHALAELNFPPKLIVPLLMTITLAEYEVKGSITC